MRWKVWLKFFAAAEVKRKIEVSITDNNPTKNQIDGFMGPDGLSCMSVEFTEDKRSALLRELYCWDFSWIEVSMKLRRNRAKSFWSNKSNQIIVSLGCRIGRKFEKKDYSFWPKFNSVQISNGRKFAALYDHFCLPATQNKNNQTIFPSILSPYWLRNGLQVHLSLFFLNSICKIETLSILTLLSRKTGQYAFITRKKG